MDRNVTALPVGGFSLDASLSTEGDDEVIVFARVYSEDRSTFLGLVQRARVDGSEWSVSLGDGWLAILPGSIYDAMELLRKIHDYFSTRKVG